MRGRGETRKANAITLGLGAGNWKGPASCWLLLMWILWAPRTGRSWRRMPQQSLLYPPIPQLGQQGQQGAQRLGAGRSLVPGGAMAESITECWALQSCSVQGHGKYSRVHRPQGCWHSASGFFQLS